MSPNKDETAVHGCSSYLHCCCSGEAGCAHACRFWPNRGVEFGWFVLSRSNHNSNSSAGFGKFVKLMKNFPQNFTKLQNWYPPGYLGEQFCEQNCRRVVPSSSEVPWRVLILLRRGH